MYLEAFTSHFSQIKDQRQTAKVTYPLFDILFLTLCGVIAGAEGWADIRDYGECHHDWFKQRGILTDGIPVDDTIARTISRIKPEEFSTCFINWMQDVHELTNGEVIAIDGKTLRGSYSREDRHSTIHMVNAFATGNKMVLGQIKTDEKSNEITAIPELIKLLDISGALISTDAMGCQVDIAHQVLEGDGDYLFGVKENQPTLCESLRHAFSEERTAPVVGLEMAKQHGRIEARAYYTKCARQLGAVGEKWPGLKTIGMVLSYRQVKGEKPQLNYRYYISSASLSEQEFAHSVRQHWMVENALHYVLDVSKNEDRSQIYQDNSADNWAVLRQMSLNMLRAEKTSLSIARKQKRAWAKTDYLEKVLIAGLNELVD